MPEPTEQEGIEPGAIYAPAVSDFLNSIADLVTVWPCTVDRSPWQRDSAIPRAPRSGSADFGHRPNGRNRSARCFGLPLAITPRHSALDSLVSG
jgi:hypothetical protein